MSEEAVDSQLLRRLVPISDLTPDYVVELSRTTLVRELMSGQILFSRGSEDNHTCYLLSGEVALDYGEGEEKVIVGGSPEARFPLDHHRPRQATAIARTRIQFISIENDRLDTLLTYSQSAGYMVAEIEVVDQGNDDGDWMTRMLQSKIFERVPPANIQAVFMKMEPVPVHQGEHVIRQGDEGDYYYYLREGRVVVTRETKSGKTIKLAELEAGTGFGEEALISDARRNANVTMLTEGLLMRLGKNDFKALLKEPVVETIAYPMARELVQQGAVWLDVRLESEHKNAAIPGSINIPLFLLRLKAPGLNRDRRYVVYCDTGRRSASAAFLLRERGIDAVVLEGGLMALKRSAQH